MSHVDDNVVMPFFGGPWDSEVRSLAPSLVGDLYFVADRVPRKKTWLSMLNITADYDVVMHGYQLMPFDGFNTACQPIGRVLGYCSISDGNSSLEQFRRFCMTCVWSDRGGQATMSDLRYAMWKWRCSNWRDRFMAEHQVEINLISMMEQRRLELAGMHASRN